MKSIKVFFMGQPLRNIYPHATRWQVFKFKVSRFIRKCVLFTGGMATIYLSFWAGGIFFPSVTYAVSEKIVEVPIQAPVLDRIAKCESKGSHLGLNGQVVMNGNTNGSVDIGLFQINEKVWGKKATEMGLDLTKEADNKKFAQYLYENFGTEPWNSSRHCWQR